MAGILALAWQTIKGIVDWRKRPVLRVRRLDAKRDILTWTFADLQGQQRKFITLQVDNNGQRTASRCIAILTIEPRPNHLPENRFDLHWTGIDYNLIAAGAQPVDIGSEGRRLDVAFTVDQQNAPGCWLAVPVALALPIPNQAFLPPGDYGAVLTVSCENGKGHSVRLRIRAPTRWQHLDATWVE